MNLKQYKGNGSKERPKAVQIASVAATSFYTSEIGDGVEVVLRLEHPEMEPRVVLTFTKEEAESVVRALQSGILGLPHVLHGDLAENTTKRTSPHSGKAWDAPGLDAPRFLERNEDHGKGSNGDPSNPLCLCGAYWSDRVGCTRKVPGSST